MTRTTIFQQEVLRNRPVVSPSRRGVGLVCEPKRELNEATNVLWRVWVRIEEHQNKGVRKCE